MDDGLVLVSNARSEILDGIGAWLPVSSELKGGFFVVKHPKLSLCVHCLLAIVVASCTVSYLRCLSLRVLIPVMVLMLRFYICLREFIHSIVFIPFSSPDGYAYGSERL